MTVTTFPNEKVIWSNKKYAIVEADVNGKRTIVVSDYWRTDYVHDYRMAERVVGTSDVFTGRWKWALDNPQWFPKYVLDKVQVIINRRHRSEKYT